MVYVFLANGCEEIEALTPVDILRRAEIETITVGIGGRVINGAHDIMITADIQEDQIRKGDIEAIVLPGGGLGTENLEQSPVVQDMIDYSIEKGILIGAICAAPSILGKKGLLAGKNATAYPSFQEYLTDAKLSDAYVCQDGNIITAKGMGVSLAFGVKLVEALRGPKLAEAIQAQVQCPQ